MSGDFRQEVRVAAAIERLSELVPAVDSNIKHIHEILNAFESGEYEASLIRLETFDADFCAGQLYDVLALARGYFKQLGLGPDAKVMLKEAEKRRENLRDYGVCLVHISDLESGRLGNHTDAAQTISEAREKEMLLRLDSIGVALSFNEIRAKFDKIRDSATGNVGAQPPENAEPPALTKEAAAVQADTADADANSQPASKITDDARLSPADIARHFPGLTIGAVSKKLERWRSSNDDGWNEVTDRKPRQPQYLYRWGNVKHLFSPSSQTSGERRAK